MSTYYHPQTDGQIDAMNKCLEIYLQSFALEKQHQGAWWLPW